MLSIFRWPSSKRLPLGERSERDEAEQPLLDAERDGDEREQRQTRLLAEEARRAAALLEEHGVGGPQVVDDLLRIEAPERRALGDAGAADVLPFEVRAVAAVEPGGDEIATHLGDAAVGDRLEDLVEREARGDRLADFVERERLAEAEILGRHALLFDPALHDVDDLVELERLEHVVVGPALHRVDRRLDGAEAGHDHGERVGRCLADGVEQLDAAHARHFQIADDEVVVAFFKLAERARSVFGGTDDIAFHAEEVREHAVFLISSFV